MNGEDGNKSWGSQMGQDSAHDELKDVIEVRRTEYSVRSCD